MEILDTIFFGIIRKLSLDAPCSISNPIETHPFAFSGTLAVELEALLEELFDTFKARDGRTTVRMSFFCFSASINSAL